MSKLTNTIEHAESQIKAKKEIIQQIIEIGGDLNQAVFAVLHAVNDGTLGHFHNAVDDLKMAVADMEKLETDVKKLLEEIS